MVWDHFDHKGRFNPESELKRQAPCPGWTTFGRLGILEEGVGQIEGGRERVGGAERGRGRERDWKEEGTDGKKAPKRNVGERVSGNEWQISCF